MAMFRRSPKSTPPLRRRQEELVQREAELREKLEKLERMIVDTPRITGDRSGAQGEERRTRDNTGDSRLEVAVALQDRRYFDERRGRRRPRLLRKARREGRIAFLLLVMALAGAVIWLMSLLHF
jgi:Mg-chelatase subunit ChlD